MILPKQIWRNLSEIEGLEDFIDYEVSNTGKVRSLKFGRKKILKASIHKDGYLLIGLWNNGKIKNFLIHRLVALAFIPNDDPTNKTEVNHISEIKSDNSVWNLEWVTPKQNANHGTRNERISKKVLCIELNQIFPSTHEASRQLGLYHSSISRCCNGKQKTSGGYHWTYI